MTTLKYLNRKLKLPQHKWLRIALGVSLIIGGILGFLPVVGFWMLPLGIAVLSIDIALVRRLRRRFVIKWKRWRKNRNK